jgi:hypothetical protein
MMRYRFLILFLSMAFFSCTGGGEGPRQEAEYEIDRCFRRGPVDLRIAVSDGEISIAERVTLLLEARSRGGYVTELPPFGEKLHEFGIVDYRTYPPRLESDSTVVTSRIYELEPFLSGEYLIPPMTLEFHAEGDTTLHYLESDTLRVTVTSILPADQEQLEIKEIAGPAELPPDRARILLVAGIAALLAATAAVILIRRRRRGRAEIALAAPHEIAFEELEILLSQQLIERQMYEEFTSRVSNILRKYIEGRFGLRAPERTTEEFLAEAGDGLDVDLKQKAILEEFLVHCDLVKFAALRPTAEDVKRTFETCRDFIEETMSTGEVRGEAA